MDKLNLMKTYVSVVETKSYTSAAKRLGKSKALVSKQVSQLEEALTIRLINRTTRNLHFTDSGLAYYHRAKQILDDVDELENSLIDNREALIGKLRVSAPQTFGETHLIDAIALLRERHPQLIFNLELNDRFVDVIGEGFEVAIRIGQLSDSNLVATKIASTLRVVCASPEYIEKHGQPTHPDQLEKHNCIIDTNLQKNAHIWSFPNNGDVIRTEVKGDIYVNSALAVASCATQGQGIACCPGFAVSGHLDSGRLIPLLESWGSEELGIYAVYPYRKHLAQKVRVFVAHLKVYFEGRAVP